MTRTLITLCLACLAIGCGNQTATMPTPNDVATGPVTMEIELGDQSQTITIDDVAEGTTLETVMRGIDEVEMEISGSGTTAFVNQIGDVATGSTEGWSFEIDGEYAKQGVGATKLSPPTTVTWSYGDYSSE